MVERISLDKIAVKGNVISFKLLESMLHSPGDSTIFITEEASVVVPLSVEEQQAIMLYHKEWLFRISGTPKSECKPD